MDSREEMVADLRWIREKLKKLGKKTPVEVAGILGCSNEEAFAYLERRIHRLQREERDLLALLKKEKA